jgi:hypothetical protein
MKKLVLTAALLALITPAFAGVKVIGTLPNGDKIVRIKTFGLFCPATTTVVGIDKATGAPYSLNAAGGPGFVPAVANAGGLVGAATVLRPARSNTNVEQSGGGSGAVNVTTGPVNNGGTTINDAGSHNHHNN